MEYLLDVMIFKLVSLSVRFYFNLVRVGRTGLLSGGTAGRAIHSAPAKTGHRNPK
jgi:hypothetical protein